MSESGAMNPNNVGGPAFPSPAAPAPRARARLTRLQGGLGGERLRALAPPLTLVVVVIVMTLGNSSFLSTGNLTTLLVQVSALLVMAIGPTFVILLGSIDISFSEIANWVSVVIAVTIVDIGYGSFPLAVLAGAAAGLVNGILIVKGRIPSLVVTLATTGLWGGLAFRLSGGPPVSIQQDRAYLEWITGMTAGIPHEAIIAFGVTVVFYLIQRYTWYGRCVYAIGAGGRSCSHVGCGCGTLQDYHIHPLWNDRRHSGHDPRRPRDCGFTGYQRWLPTLCACRRTRWWYGNLWWFRRCHPHRHWRTYSHQPAQWDERDGPEHILSAVSFGLNFGCSRALDHGSLEARKHQVISKVLWPY